MTIRGVPDETRDRLAERADRAGQSLQQYMRARLVDLAATSTLDDLLDRAEARRGNNGIRDLTEDIVQSIREARDS